MLLWVSFICIECPIGINKKLFPLCGRNALRFLDNSIKSLHSLASYSKSIDLINPEMLSQWTDNDLSWIVKNCLLFHNLKTSRTLFLVLADVSFWDVNPTAEHSPLKVSGLMSGCWILLVSRILAGHLLLVCMQLPQLQQCHNVQNESNIPCYHLAYEQESLGHKGLVLWQKEYGHSAYSWDSFLSDLSWRYSSP